jgi:hypothetical protein
MLKKSVDMDFHQSHVPFYSNNDWSMHASIARRFDGKIRAPHECLMQRKETMKKLPIKDYSSRCFPWLLDYSSITWVYKVDHILQSIINFLLVLETMGWSGSTTIAPWSYCFGKAPRPSTSIAKPFKKKQCDLVTTYNYLPKSPKKHTTLLASLSKTQCDLVVNYSSKYLKKHDVIWLTNYSDGWRKEGLDPSK